MTTRPAPRPMPPSVPLSGPPSHGTAGIVLGLAALTTGLMAGVYYAYACSVMPGLARTGDRTFIDAMQQINVAIQNPVLFAAFSGRSPALRWPACSNGGSGGATPCAGSPPRWSFTQPGSSPP
jgi:hypothetical protein